MAPFNQCSQLNKWNNAWFGLLLLTLIHGRLYTFAHIYNPLRFFFNCNNLSCLLVSPTFNQIYDILINGRVYKIRSHHLRKAASI